MANILSDRTKNIDKTLERLSKEFKRTDIKSAREGEAQPTRAGTNNVSWGTPGQFPLDGIKPVMGENVGLTPNRDIRFSQVRPSSVIKDHENLQLPSEAVQAMKTRK